MLFVARDGDPGRALRLRARLLEGPGGLVAARRLCAARNWPVIDVTRRSIEETAATVFQHIERWQQRKAEQQVAPAPA